MGRGAQAGRRSGQSVRLRGFVAADGVYDSGLTTLSREGFATTGGSPGVETRWGAYGGRNDRRSAVGLDYQGDYRYYSKAATWNGTNQILTLTYAAQPFRRVNFDVGAVAGTTNRAFGGATPGQGLASSVASGIGSNIGQLAVPNTSLFDVRTNYLGGNGSVTFIHSARLSSNFSGSGFTVRRRNRLPGVDGVIGRADLSYRLNRRSTIGLDVSFSKFDYTNLFGDTHVVDPGVLYSLQVGRNFEFGLRGGVMRIESFGVKQVNFEPEIAALLGVGQTTEIFYLRTYQASGGAQLLRRFKRGSVHGQVQIAPNPGNGLILASRQVQTVASGDYRVTRQLSLQVSGGVTRLRSVTSLAGNYQQYFLGGGFGYKINRAVEFHARVDRRVAQLQTTSKANLNGTRFMVGIAYSPSDVPLQLW